ncbi:right-handed parallel beta-helix repeat-containing protein [Methanolapillus africanus]
MGTSAAAIGGTGADGDPYVINDNTNYTAWNDSHKAANQFILVTSPTLLDEVLQNAEQGSTILLVTETYTADQYLVSADGLTITNNATGDVPTIELTGRTDGFKVNGFDGVTIQNVILDGNGTADYGFRIQNATNITMDNVTAINMVKSAFDLSRNIDCVYTNLTAQDNGGFGISITQGENVTVSGNTKNNSWGGINVNNKQHKDSADINTTSINISGVVSTDDIPVVLEEYDVDEPQTVQSVIAPSLGVNLTNTAFMISNPAGINTAGTIFGKIILLNPANDPETNGDILENVLENATEETQISVPPGEFNVSSDEVPNNVTLSLSGGTDINGELTYGDGKPIDYTIRENGSGGGTGKATVVNTTAPANTTNVTDPAVPDNTSDTSSNTSTNTTPNDTPNATPEPETDSVPNPTSIVLIVVLIVIGAGAYYYFYVKPKQK